MTPDSITNAVNWRTHTSNMVDIIAPNHIELLRIAWTEKQKQFPVIGDFNLKNPNVRKTIAQLGKRITSIAETTRTDIRGILETALTGEGKIPGTDTIAKLIRDSGATNSVSRSKMIAQTETAVAFNTGAVISYREAGIEKVEVLDGDEDEDCASVNGTIQTLEWAMENPVAHPHCQRAFAPVVGD